MERYVRYITRLFKTYLLRDRFLLAAKQWFKDDGDNTLRLQYELNEGSTVFDIGGFYGNFAQQIHQMYGSSIYVFEPVNAFYKELEIKFRGVGNVKLFKFGLSNVNSQAEINLDHDGSSLHQTGCYKEIITLISIEEFIREHDIKNIDLMKINIEGGEYEILPVLLESGLIKQVKNIQIQFHDFIPNAIEKREKIRGELSKTHELTYDYYFIWENWKLK